MILDKVMQRKSVELNATTFRRQNFFILFAVFFDKQHLDRLRHILNRCILIFQWLATFFKQ